MPQHLYRISGWWPIAISLEVICSSIISLKLIRPWSYCRNIKIIKMSHSWLISSIPLLISRFIIHLLSTVLISLVRSLCINSIIICYHIIIFWIIFVSIFIQIKYSYLLTVNFFLKSLSAFLSAFSSIYFTFCYYSSRFLSIKCLAFPSNFLK
jgi:hypothetical protein